MEELTALTPQGVLWEDGVLDLKAKECQMSAGRDQTE
jgi:hypothetical protein